METQNRKSWFITLIAVLILAPFFFAKTGGDFRAAQERKIPQIAALKEYIFNGAAASEVTAELSQNRSSMDEFVVFLSLCNVRDRAIVVKGKGETLETAWENAERNAKLIIPNKKYKVVWVKADIVDSAEEIPTVDLNKEVVNNYYRYFCRKGIALDRNFNTAFLEGEVNGNKLMSYYTERQLVSNQVDYDSNLLNLKNINYYLKAYYGRPELTEIPDKVTIFTTKGFFCGEDGSVHELYTDGVDHGRRVIDLADDKVVKTAIINASKYLYGSIQPDGRFIYGYYPVFDNLIKGYNIIRHAGSIWSMINLYRMTGDEELVPKLDSAVDHLVKDSIEYKDPDVAYVVERNANEVKLGGNGISIIMLTEYMDVFKTDKYVEIVRHLANGILELQEEDGTFYHVLYYPGYTRKAQYRIVYYDGEATFALARAYTYTRDQKYLDGAVKAVENFIEKNYVRYRDHWVAYSLNEVTKYVPEPRFYEFALRNVRVNLDRIYNQATSYHTYLELLMAGWQTYERLLESGIKVKYLDRLDTKYFAETIYKRAFHMLNGYFYPEIAMYMKKPYKILDAFFVRHDSFRVRMDDVQHFIGGYYYYTVYYDKIRPYLSDEFLSGIHKTRR